MRKQIILDCILIILLVLLIGVIVKAIFDIQTQGYKCMNNPGVYAMKKYSEIYKEEVYCSCNLGIFINSTVMFQEIRISGGGIDWSKINLTK